MAISDAQRKAIEEVMSAVRSVTGTGRNKRVLCTMFLELVDRESWPEYYEVIPEPRCLTLIKSKLEKNGYKNAMDVLYDLKLVFQNALYYNEPSSQISKDALTLKGVLQEEWKKHTVLPVPKDSPPPEDRKKEVAASAVKAEAQTSTTNSQISPSKVAAPPTIAPAPTPAPPPTTTTQYGGGSSDIDVDVGGNSEGEGDGDGDADPLMEDMGLGPRDPESDEIIRRLEKTLPRWEGFNDKGWVETMDMDRCLNLILAIKGHKDIINARYATAIDSISEESTVKYQSYNYPLSLKIIEGKARSKAYLSSKDFDLDMARLFEKARRWHEPGTEQYGNVLLLQRLYQALSSSSPPSGPPYTSQSNFASIPAGPGNAKPLHAANEDSGIAVTTFRVSTKDRHFIDELNYKGWSIRLADWLHLANPDDPSRPIIAQVFRCWISDEISKKGQPGVTVCWYYRQEQTYHPANREFWEGEVFKTGHFADHPQEDIIEKIACQFTARHIRGRPRAPFWYPGWPLYVCDSRYNDRVREFVRIKNWNSCVPEEVRKSTEFMPIYPFERMVWPQRFASPFLTGKLAQNRNVKFPGAICESMEKADGDRVEGTRKRAKKPGPLGPPGPGSTRTLAVVRSEDITRGTYPSATPAVGGSTSQTGAYPYLSTYGAQSQLPSQSRRVEDRSIIAAAGGAAILGAGAHIEKLPHETVKHFDRDPSTNEVLWFSGPPVDIAKPSAPRYSLNYLHFLAMKRKKAMEGTDTATKDREIGADSGDLIASRQKRQKVAPPTASETLDRLWNAVWGQDGENAGQP